MLNPSHGEKVMATQETVKDSLRGRGLLTLEDLSDEEFLYLIDLAGELKARKAAGVRGDLLARKSIAMVFEKMSTRTRCAAAVAVADEGGSTEYLSAQDTHLGKKESVADTARVLGRIFDGILFRGYRQETANLLARHSGIPVWNGLTDQTHPTQALADLLTVKEHFGRLAGLKMVYMGDGRNNVACSLMTACAKGGVNVVNCTPPELAPTDALVDRARRLAAANGSRVDVVHDPAEAVRGAHVVYTDVWVSMGEETKFAERLALLKPYQVTMETMERTGNLDRDQVIFMHCLPAFHNRETEVTRGCGALEVSDEVFEGEFSRVFEGAENRLHTIKALFVAALGRGQDCG